MSCDQKSWECLQCLKKCGPDATTDTPCYKKCTCPNDPSGMPIYPDPSCIACLKKDPNPQDPDLTKCGCNPPPPAISLLHILLIAGGVVVVVGVTIGLIVYFNTKKKSKK